MAFGAIVIVIRKVVKTRPIRSSVNIGCTSSIGEKPHFYVWNISCWRGLAKVQAKYYRSLINDLRRLRIAND